MLERQNIQISFRDVKRVPYLPCSTPPRKFKNPMTALIYLMIYIWGKGTSAANSNSVSQTTAIVWGTSKTAYKTHNDLLKRAHAMARTQKKSLNILNIL